MTFALFFGLVFISGIALLGFYGNGERFRKMDVDKELESMVE